ncbi:MAG: hypothetical protein ACJAZ3_001248, partial [Sphingobacteriales bacterium]
MTELLTYIPMRKLILSFVLIIFSSLVFSQPIKRVVENNLDAGTGSLRMALSQAKDGDTIWINPSLSNQTLVLSTGQLVIGASVKLIGNGFTINANSSSRVFSAENLASLTIDGFTITGGSATFTGAGIFADAVDELIIQHCNINGNALSAAAAYTYAHGGGIYASSCSSIVITNNTISNNTVSAPAAYTHVYGGGIYTSLSSSVLIKNNVISDNAIHVVASHSHAYGGGVYTSLSSSALIENNVISANSLKTEAGASHAKGAGVYAASDVLIKNNTIRENKASNVGSYSYALGGGVYSNSKVTIEKNAIFDNELYNVAAYSHGYGGGVCVISASPFVLKNNTISGNTSDNIASYSHSLGAGVYADKSSSILIKNNTICENAASVVDASSNVHGGGVHASKSTFLGNIIAKNTVAGGILSGPNAFLTDEINSVTSGYNLIGDNSSAENLFEPDENNDIVGTTALPIDPLLNPLADKGGATWVMSLTEGSLAIDPAGRADFGEDQRGAEVVNYLKDIGAFEYSQFISAIANQEVGCVSTTLSLEFHIGDLPSNLNGVSEMAYAINKDFVPDNGIFITKSTASGYTNNSIRYLELNASSGVPDSSLIIVVVDDGAGRKDSISFTLKLVDTIKPILLTHDTILYLDANGMASLDSLSLDSGTNDACGLASIELSKYAFDCDDLGTNGITFTAVDVNTNSASKTVFVTVVDSIKP